MSDGLVEVRMLQQMSGPRPDGQAWPPAGGKITVPAGEAAWLCGGFSNNGNEPMAVPVVEKRKVETADAPEDPKVETRAEAKVEAKVEAAATPPRPASAVPDSPPPEVKRGPGRPPKNGR